MEEGKNSLQAPDIRPGPRTSGPWSILLSSLPATQHLQAPDIRPEPGHPATREAPDIRPPARTSGACLRAETGQRPLYPLLTYPFVG